MLVYHDTFKVEDYYYRSKFKVTGAKKMLMHIKMVGATSNECFLVQQVIRAYLLALVYRLVQKICFDDIIQ